MRGVLPHLKALVGEFEQQAEFRMVYITEAHATDVWPISSSRYSFDGKPVQVSAPKSNKERCGLAMQFVKNYDLSSWLPVHVDPVGTNPFEKEYSPWPIRFYILLKGDDGTVRIACKLKPQGAAYDLAEVRNFLMTATR